MYRNSASIWDIARHFTSGGNIEYVNWQTVRATLLR